MHLRPLFFALIATACGSSPDAPDAGESAFEGTVVPVFEAHCVQCHQGENAQAGLDLTRDHAAAELLGPDASTRCFEGGAQIERRLVAPGNPEESVLWIKISDTDLSLECGREMPVTGTALLASDPNDAEILRMWIEDGALVGDPD